MRRIRPNEIRQAKRFSTGQERVEPSLVERYKEAADPLAGERVAARVDHYEKVLLDAIREDGEEFERRMEMLRDAEQEIAAEQAFDAERARSAPAEPQTMSGAREADLR